MKEGNKPGSYMNVLSSNTQAAIRSQAPERFVFTCESAVLPGRAVSLKEARTYGPIRRIPWDQTYTDVTLTFIVGGDMFEKLFFEAWVQSLYDPITNNWNYYKEYIAPIDIFQQNTKDESIYGIRLDEAYPSTIADLSVAHTDTDNFHKLSVTIAYRRWLELDEFKNFKIDGRAKGFNNDSLRISEWSPEKRKAHGYHE